MGNILNGVLGGNNGGLGAGGGGYGLAPELQCCDAVVDPISLLVTIGGIAAVSLFLRQAVIDFMVMGAGRRKRSNSLHLLISQGTEMVYRPVGSPSIFFDVDKWPETISLSTN